MTNKQFLESYKSIAELWVAAKSFNKMLNDLDAPFSFKVNSIPWLINAFTNRKRCDNIMALVRSTYYDLISELPKMDKNQLQELSDLFKENKSMSKHIKEALELKGKNNHANIVAGCGAISYAVASVIGNNNKGGYSR